MTSKILLLSIQPKFAEKIFDGSKTIELRRVKPKLSEKDYIIVYVSSPIKQIQGVFEVKQIIEKPIEELWISVKSYAGVTKQEFDNYFSGVRIGYGIYIGDMMNVLRPIELNEIKKQWVGFHPPQSYKYLTQSEFSLIKSLSG